MQKALLLSVLIAIALPLKGISAFSPAGQDCTSGHDSHNADTALLRD
ncbi:hypothetical protein XMM379_000214 [Aliiroseovarius sp. xm-m-379]|nr:MULTISPECIES: hypothetical protein [unclassified Aliiroseovarius]NRP14059.1 hypothetical protein [Aliiroseovarius sp. xm-d-517]NRP23543.1 hypothetical protein [Aliiroseovarius sp. xm-m-379]NRP29210.1 hypothetical protein [Aliiroseovarius sp. xm-m-314]NRP32342.1 hypothetical protein [Aliiroseovarius sp. xm-a-104]NRP40875.1 hypothetical protein [Aliiroseovarius sp. xm-m-339-2]